jgi:hemoglobin-like flavoprotein
MTHSTYGAAREPQAGGVDAYRLDPRSVRLVQDSVRLLRGQEQRLAVIFYGHLFELVPEARRLFPADMGEQHQRLLAALLAAVESLDDPGRMERELLSLGEEHYHRGVEDHQFQYVAHALIRAVRELLPGDWSSSVSSAWVGLYTWMTTFMVAGSRRARGRALGYDPATPGPA